MTAQSRYQIGYRSPPRGTRFRKGKSGNPHGRPLGTRNLKTDLAEELQEAIIVKQGGTQRSVSKQRAIIKALTNRAMQGDTKAIAQIAGMALRLLPQETDDNEDKSLAPDDKAILERYTARIRNQMARSRR